MFPILFVYIEYKLTLSNTTVQKFGVSKIFLILY